VTPYLDTSLLISLLGQDAFSAQARRLTASLTLRPLVGDFAEAEFASVVAMPCRTGHLTRSEGQAMLAGFDAWRARHLRAPDALHLAISSRIGRLAVTFDAGMAAAARSLGLPVLGP
jgi:predicted nucleic acid-binding protein